MSDLGIIRRKRIISAPEGFFSAPVSTPPAGLVWLKTDNPAGQAGPAGSFTYTSAALGSTGTRLTIVVSNVQNDAITALTVGGLPAIKAIEESGAISCLQMWYVDTTSLGANANIVLTSAGSSSHSVIMVGKLTGATATPTATQTRTFNTSDPTTITATVPSGGVGLAAFFLSTNVPGSWSNATLDYTTIDTTGGGELTLGNTTVSGSQTPSYTTTGVDNHGVMACWGP